MARGGYRWDGNSNWNSGKTGTIRVPLTLHKQVLELAHALDNGYEVIINEEATTDVLHIKRVAELVNEQVKMHERYKALAEVMLSYEQRVNTSPRWDKAVKLMEDIAKIIPWKQAIETFKPLLANEFNLKKISKAKQTEEQKATPK
jgi:hypothetical protein